MIRYGLFDFAAPPRTGTTWFLKAATMAALGELSKFDVHKVFIERPRHEVARMRVSLVRHPATWLRSYYSEIYPGVVGVPAVDVFGTIAADDVFDWMDKCVDSLPGQVGAMFAAYEADSCLRMEDFPNNAVELFGSVGVARQYAVACRTLGKQNASRSLSPIPKVLRGRRFE